MAHGYTIKRKDSPSPTEGAKVCPPKDGVKGGEKMYRTGGSIGVFGRLKNVPPAAFHRADYQLMEGGMDVSRGDVFFGESLNN